MYKRKNFFYIKRHYHSYELIDINLYWANATLVQKTEWSQEMNEFRPNEPYSNRTLFNGNLTPHFADLYNCVDKEKPCLKSIRQIQSILMCVNVCEFIQTIYWTGGNIHQYAVLYCFAYEQCLLHFQYLFRRENRTNFVCRNRFYVGLVYINQKYMLPMLIYGCSTPIRRVHSIRKPLERQYLHTQ